MKNQTLAILEEFQWLRRTKAEDQKICLYCRNKSLEGHDKGCSVAQAIFENGGNPMIATAA